MIILIFVVGIGGFQGIRSLSIPINNRFSNEKASSSASSSSSSTSLNANPRKIDVGSDNGFQANVRVIIVYIVYILLNYYFSCSPYKFDLMYIFTITTITGSLST
jgi:hypothetical protein